MKKSSSMKREVYKCKYCGLRIIKDNPSNLCPVCGNKITKEELSDNINSTQNLSTEHM